MLALYLLKVTDFTIAGGLCHAYDVVIVCSAFVCMKIVCQCHNFQLCFSFGINGLVEVQYLSNLLE